MSTEAQAQAFTESEPLRSAVARALGLFMQGHCTHLVGCTVDEAYIGLYDEAPEDYQRVAALRNAMKDIRQAGLVKDSGVKRANYNNTSPQTVWVMGDDRSAVMQQRIEKAVTLLQTLGLANSLNVIHEYLTSVGASWSIDCRGCGE